MNRFLLHPNPARIFQYSILKNTVCATKMGLCPPLLPIAVRAFHSSGFVQKDKIFKDIPARAVKKSNTATNEPKKIRSPEEQQKLNEKREDREQKKKEIRQKQIEIQKKRDALKDEKSSKKANKVSNQNDE